MSKISYIHNNINAIIQRCTIAYSPISYPFLAKCLSLSLESGQHPHFSLLVGVALVHPKDQYNKKIGRELAEKQLGTVKFSLSLVTSDVNYIDYYFSGHHMGKNVELDCKLRVYKDSHVVRVMHIMPSMEDYE